MTQKNTFNVSMEEYILPLLKPVKTRKCIADEYEIDVRTLGRWFFKHDLSFPSGALTPRSQRIIYEAFGPPLLKKI